MNASPRLLVSLRSHLIRATTLSQHGRARCVVCLVSVASYVVHPACVASALYTLMPISFLKVSLVAQLACVSVSFVFGLHDIDMIDIDKDIPLQSTVIKAVPYGFRLSQGARLSSAVFYSCNENSAVLNNYNEPMEPGRFAANSSDS